MRKKILTVLLLFVAFITLILYGMGRLTNVEEKVSQLPEPSILYIPPPNTNAEKGKDIPLRFVVMADCRGSDIGINAKAISKTFKSIKKLSPQPQFAVMPGDLVGGADSYSEIKAQLLNFKNTVTQYYPIDFFYPGFGNHEATAGTSGEMAFKEVFSEIKVNPLEGYNDTVYYFDKNDTRFYMLNSNHPGESHIISDTQLNWIKANTDQNKKHNLYFFHEPAYPTGAHVGSSLDANKLQRDKLWEIIDHSINPMAFCGHEHNYSRRHINSDFNETIYGRTFKFNKLVYQVTTGTFGATVYKDYTDNKNVDVPPIPEYHFAVVDISTDKIQVTVYDLNGKIIDHFEQ